ncbi:MAG: hypothetical protein COV44_08185 [Deltaproteobacteria bacterium CG11_big_fil_rev_8_21_14_0_20_45_16]|nr:MAG: hypothetical protein COV44_08185 [Deltaproteobacteria bacterium CG11_big_fil_rev_8_21_14_0_20_45_16]
MALASLSLVMSYLGVILVAFLSSICLCQAAESVKISSTCFCLGQIYRSGEKLSNKMNGGLQKTKDSKSHSKERDSLEFSDFLNENIRFNQHSLFLSLSF